MILSDQQLGTTLERIAWLKKQVAHLRTTETNPVTYRAAVSGFLGEMDQMQHEVRECFSFLPGERGGSLADSHRSRTRPSPHPGSLPASFQYRSRIASAVSVVYGSSLSFSASRHC